MYNFKEKIVKCPICEHQLTENYEDFNYYLSCDYCYGNFVKDKNEFKLIEFN